MTVNGTEYAREVEPRLLLIHFIRDELGLTGSHWGCDTSNCGACVVLMDGKPVKSCTILAAMAPAVAAPAPSITPAKRTGRPTRTAAAPAAPGKRPVGRPRKAVTAAAPATRAVGRPRKSAAAPAPAKRPVGRPRTRPVGRPPRS